MVMEDVSAAWHAYKRNFKPLLGAILLIYAVIYGIVAIGFVPMFFFPSALVFSIAVMIVMVAVGAVISYAFLGGYINMCAEALKKRTRVSTMIRAAKKKWKSFVGVGLLVLAITMGVFVVFYAPFIAGIVLQSSSLMGFGIVSLVLGYVAIFIVAILLMFSFQAVALDSYRAVDAVKRSYRISRANFLHVVALMILLGVVIVAVAILPALLIGFIISLLFPSLSLFMAYYFGFIIGLVFATPIQYLGVTSFYIRNRRKVKSKVKRKK